MKEITSASYFDDDKERAAVVQKDVALKILSKASGAAMRGYDESEIAKVEAETVAGVNALASAAGALGGGFPNQGTEDDEEEDDEGGEGDEE
jgi:propanediol dehydratase large subunit